MKHNDITEGFNLVSSVHEPEDDKTILDLSDTRKPTLTLRDLNKLRKIREKNKLNRQTDIASLEVIYGSDSKE